MFPAFTLARLPRIIFGHGVRAQLPELISTYGKRTLLVTGAHHFLAGQYWLEIRSGLKAHGISWELLGVADEPSPDLVDDSVRTYRNAGFNSVIGLGGGSALDAAKAIAGLLKPGNSVMDHLEGVGPELPYHGPSTPFIAVPTTAGTGSEATKNAVLSIQGPEGFKKSFRDEKLVAQIALLDPDLLTTCPRRIIASNGMDAFTQLLESYVSSKANRFTDALAWSGMKATRNSLLEWYEKGQEAADAQAGMAYAALLSGITLAQVGLGSVHGLASPLGAYFPIPHGVACGSLVAEATAMNIHALQARGKNHEALMKYAQVGRLLARDTHLSDMNAFEQLVGTLAEWTDQMQLPRLSEFGVSTKDIPRIVTNSRGSSMKTNPVFLEDAEIATILANRI